MTPLGCGRGFLCAVLKVEVRSKRYLRKRTRNLYVFSERWESMGKEASDRRTATMKARHAGPCVFFFFDIQIRSRLRQNPVIHY